MSTPPTLTPEAKAKLVEDLMLNLELFIEAGANKRLLEAQPTSKLKELAYERVESILDRLRSNLHKQLNVIVDRL